MIHVLYMLPRTVAVLQRYTKGQSALEDFLSLFFVSSAEVKVLYHCTTGQK